MGPDAEIIAAWIAAGVAILGTTATAILQLVFWRLDQKEKRSQEIMQHRKDALISALEVIDHVYANTAWHGRPPVNPHQWDIKLARDAMNKMILYCKNPDRVVTGFCKAVGLHNPETQTPGKYGPADLSAFRDIVCDELNLPPTTYKSKDATWIGGLPGAIKIEQTSAS